MTAVLYSILGFLIFENLVELYLTLRQVSNGSDFSAVSFFLFFVSIFYIFNVTASSLQN